MAEEREDISMVGIDQFVTFAKRHPPLFSMVTKRLGLDEDFNEDKSKWISYKLLAGFANEMYICIHEHTEVFGDSLEPKPASREKFICDIVSNAYKSKAFEYFGFVAALLVDPVVIWSRLSKMVESNNRYNSVDFELLASNFAICRGKVTMTYKEQDPLNEVLSEMSLGSIYGLADMIGYPVVSLERKRSVIYGDDICEYEFTWIRHDHYKTTIMGLGTWTLSTIGLAVFFPSIGWFDVVAYPILISLLVFLYVKNKSYMSKTDEVFNLHNKVNEELNDKSKSFRFLDGQLDKTKKELESSIKLAAAGEMSYGHLHDMESAISVIVMSSQILKENVNGIPGDTEPWAKYLQTVDAAAEQLVRMQNLIRKVSTRGDLGPMVPSSITSAIESAADLIGPIAEKAKVEICVSLADKGQCVTFAPDGLIESVILNLLNNSVRALASVERGKITLSSSIVGNDVEIKISDNGPGIPQEVLGRAKRPFSTRDDSDGYMNKTCGGKIISSGFGLYKIRQSINSINGQFDIFTSRSGSEFVVRLVRFDSDMLEVV